MAGLPCQGLLGIVRTTLNWVILVKGKVNWGKGILGFITWVKLGEGGNCVSGG